MQYAVVIAKADSNFSAYVPDLPGCVATGETRAEVESLLREAIENHLEGLRADGPPVPAPSSPSTSPSSAKTPKALERGDRYASKGGLDAPTKSLGVQRTMAAVLSD